MAVVIVTLYLAKIWLKLNMFENADIPRPCEANQEENEWSRDINISCGSTRALAHGKVGIYPRGVCFVCDRYSHSETAHGKSLWIHKKEQKNYP